MTGIDLGGITENSIVSGKDGGRFLCNIIYILYIFGFFFLIPAIAGLVLAFSQDKADEPYRSHFAYQRRIFLLGLAYMAGIGGLTLLSPFTFGLSALLGALLGLVWLAWTILKIVRGMQTLGRQERIG